MDKLFISWCETYHMKVLKYLYFTVGNIEDAKDLTQEAFIIVYNRKEELKEHNNIGGFIFQTAKYLVANYKRKVSKKNAKETRIEFDITSNCLDLYDEIETINDRKIDVSLYINRIIKELSEDKQLLYRLYYIENKSHKEIAKILNVNETSLRMKYVRLRRDIKKIIHLISEDNFIINM